MCLPNGFRKDGTPTALTFTGHHLKRPPQAAWVAEEKGDRRE